MDQKDKQRYVFTSSYNPGKNFMHTQGQFPLRKISMGLDWIGTKLKPRMHGLLVPIFQFWYQFEPMIL